MIVIANSTPLVHLSAIGNFQLLQKLFNEIFIPEEVYQEVVVHGAGKPGSKEVKKAKWIKKVAVENKLAFSAYTTRFGLGESGCLVLAKEMNADLLIMDDRAARTEAELQDLKVTGTVGVLLMADQMGLINFQKGLDDLLASGFRLNIREYNRIIELWRSRKDV